MNSQGLARALFSSNVAAVHDVLSGVTDETWNDLLEIVSPAMLPYLDFTLRAAHLADALPPDARRALTSAGRSAVLTGLQQRSVLKTLLSCLATQHIDAVLLKGAALANSLYPEPHLRPMADLDVWVPAADLPKAVRCLLDSGFEVPEGGLADGWLSPTLSQHRLRAVGVGVRVELHGTVHSLECLSPEGVEGYRRRTEPLAIGGVGALMLCPEDALVHTCLRLAMTNRFASSQLPLFDVFLIIDKWSTRIDWAAIARSSRTEGIAVYVTIALTLARRVWGARVPDEYFALIGDIQGLGELEDLALEQVWEVDPALPPALERLLRLPAGPARLSAFVHRMFVEPWQSPMDEQRRGWDAARAAARRWMNDLTIKVPRYVRAWASGDLSRPELSRRAGLAQRRGRIGTLASQAEAQLRSARSR